MQDRRLALSGTIPGEDFPYSDHEGVEATFLLEERDTAISVPQRIYDGERVQLAATLGAHNLWDAVLINILQVPSREFNLGTFFLKL